MNIPGYVIESKIGQGGMAMVYRARQESLGRPVALKVLNPLYSDSDEFTARFLAEGRMLAALSHPNIVAIHDLGVAGGLHFIAMEYVDRPDLGRVMRQPVPVERAVSCVLCVASALAHAHEAGIVHRDVKPSNVLFRDEDTPLLSDFGIARRIDGDSEHTLTGTAIGSPYYLSPEQARGRPVDGRADIYSLGIMLYELLAGARPFSGESELDTMMMHVNDELPALPAALSAFQPLLESMTAKEADARLPDMSAVVNQLEQARDRWREGAPVSRDDAQTASERPEAPAAEVAPRADARAPDEVDEPRDPASTPARPMARSASARAALLRSVAVDDAVACRQAECALAAAGHAEEAGLLALVGTLGARWRQLADALTPAGDVGEALRVARADLAGADSATFTAMGAAMATQVAGLRDEQRRLRAAGDTLEAALEGGEALARALVPSAAGRKADVAQVQFLKQLTLVLGRRLGALERLRPAYEQAILSAEFIARNREQLDRGFRRLAEARTDSSLRAIEDFVVQVLPMTNELLDELQTLTDAALGAAGEAQQARDAAGELHERLFG